MEQNQKEIKRFVLQTKNGRQGISFPSTIRWHKCLFKRKHNLFCQQGISFPSTIRWHKCLFKRKHNLFCQKFLMLFYKIKVIVFFLYYFFSFFRTVKWIVKSIKKRIFDTSFFSLLIEVKKRVKLPRIFVLYVERTL